MLKCSKRYTELPLWILKYAVAKITKNKKKLHFVWVKIYMNFKIKEFNLTMKKALINV